MKIYNTDWYTLHDLQTLFNCSDELKKAFEEMDKDGSGSLTKEELEAGLSSHGFEGEQAKCIVEELDYDSDGKYNLKEFLESVSFSEMFAKAYKF